MEINLRGKYKKDFQDDPNREKKSGIFRFNQEIGKFHYLIMHLLFFAKGQSASRNQKLLKNC
jgi:hypothetical protein